LQSLFYHFLEDQTAVDRWWEREALKKINTNISVYCYGVKIYNVTGEELRPQCWKNSETKKNIQHSYKISFGFTQNNCCCCCLLINFHIITVFHWINEWRIEKERTKLGKATCLSLLLLFFMGKMFFFLFIGFLCIFSLVLFFN
jgi:hypothetical protein